MWSLFSVTEKRINIIKLKKEEKAKHHLWSARAVIRNLLAMSYYEFNSQQTISDVDLRWRAAIFFFYAYTSLLLFRSLSSQQKNKPFSLPFYLPQTFRRLSRLVRTTSMIIRFCIAKCLCVYVWFLFFGLLPCLPSDRFFLLSIHLTTKQYGYKSVV